MSLEDKKKKKKNAKVTALCQSKIISKSAGVWSFIGFGVIFGSLVVELKDDKMKNILGSFTNM